METCILIINLAVCSLWILIILYRRSSHTDKLQEQPIANSAETAVKKSEEEDDLVQRVYVDSDLVEGKPASKSTFGSFVYTGRGVVKWALKTQKKEASKGEHAHFVYKRCEAVEVCNAPIGLKWSLRSWGMSACTLQQNCVGRLSEGLQDSTLFKALLCTNMFHLWSGEALQHLYATDSFCANTLRRWCVKTLRHTVKHPRRNPRTSRCYHPCNGHVVMYADDYLLFSTLRHLTEQATNRITVCHSELSKIPPVEVNTLFLSSPNEQYMGEDRRK